MVALVRVDHEAVSRLNELGIRLEWITNSLRRGDAESRSVSLLAPKGFEGVTRWGRAAEAFREQLCERGWTPDDALNIARSISPDGESCVVVTTGSKGTGLDGGEPSTKYPKGAGTVASVEQNLMFDFDAADLARLGMARTASPTMRTWLLLFLAEGNKIYAELSLPDGISDEGFICSWRERIIVPVIELGPATFVSANDTGPNEPVVVPVSRR
jgi:hypothetical protein